MLAVLVLSAGLGASSLVVDTEFTTAPYFQTTDALVLSSPANEAESLFGYFSAGPQDWSSVNLLYLRAAPAGSNPWVFSTVALLDEDLRTIATYEVSPELLGNDFGLLPLRLTQTGSGDPTRLSGLEFVWNGSVPEGSGLALQSLVGASAPITPSVTSALYAVGKFTMTWSGTGNLPVNVQRRESLDSGEWITVAGGVTTSSYMDSSAPAGRAFYRVVVP